MGSWHWLWDCWAPCWGSPGCKGECWLWALQWAKELPKAEGWENRVRAPCSLADCLKPFLSTRSRTDLLYLNPHKLRQHRRGGAGYCNCWRQFDHRPTCVCELASSASLPNSPAWMKQNILEKYLLLHHSFPGWIWKSHTSGSFPGWRAGLLWCAPRFAFADSTADTAHGALACYSSLSYKGLCEHTALWKGFVGISQQGASTWQSHVFWRIPCPSTHCRCRCRLNISPVFPQ